MPEYKLDFPVSVGSAAPIKSLSDAVREVADRTNLGTGNTRAFNQILGETAQRTGSVSAALRDLSTKQSPFKDFAKDLQAYVKEQQQAQNETQKWGRMMETAYQENARREAKRASDAKKAADEIIAQHERVEKSLGRIGARLGGSALGSAAGLPGVGRVSGTLLGSMGLSGGAMAGIGGAAAGLFLGVEFTKSLDNLAKWSQEQKNMAAETGMTVTEMEQLSRISDATGVKLAGAAKSVADLSKEMMQGGGRAREIQAALGDLDLKASVAFEKPYQSLTDIQQALTNVKDPADRARIAIELLGESAGRAVAATAGASKSTHIIDAATIDDLVKAREKMADVGDSWDILKSKFSTPLNALLNFTTKTINAGEAGASIIQTTLAAAGLIKPLKYAGGQGPGTAPKTWSDEIDKKNLQNDAEAAAARNQQWQTWEQTHGGTGRDRYASTNAQIATDEQSLHERYQRGELTDSQMQSQRAQLEARKAAAEAARKSQEQYQSQIERFGSREGGFPADPADVLRQFREFPKSYSQLGNYGPYRSYMGQLQAAVPGAAQQYGRNMLEKQFPGVATGDYSKLYSPMGKDNKEFQDDLERQAREARQSNEQLKQTSAQRIDDINRQQRDSTAVNEAGVQLRGAGATSLTNLLIRQRGLTPSGAGQLQLQDQLRRIQESFTAKAAPLTSAIAGLQGVPGADDEQRDQIKRAIAAQQADLQKLQNERLTQSVEAIGKFNDTLQEASDKIGEQFGSFISGLAAAGREGHAGTYTKNYMLGQSDKIISNFASSMYKPGMFEIPGQGTSDNPTMLGKMLQGTMFGTDPKAHANDALQLVTDQNTKATVDNTTVMAAVYEALGGDPTSLGLTNLPAMPTLTGATSSVALPFFGAAGAAGAAGAGSLLTSVIKAFGGPGVTAPSGSGESIGTIGTITTTSGGTGTGLTSLFRSMAGGSATGGTGGSGEQIGTLSDQIQNAGGAPAFGTTEQIGTIQNPFGVPYEVAQGSPAGSGYFSNSNPLTNLFNVNGTASPGQMVGAGLQLGGEAFGTYKGVTQMLKGGAQNAIGGIGETAMSIAPLTGPALAPFVMAGGALMSIISSIMGNPVQERQAHINSELMNNQYIAPQAINRTMDISGGYADLNYQGNVRATDLSSVPIIQQAYSDPRHGVIVPGTVISPFGGGGGPVQVPVGDRGAYTTDSGTGGHTVNVTNNVSAIDGDSVAQFFQNNSQALGDGIVTALNKGGTDLANRMRTL
jgi:hypothetical protein